MTDNSASSGTRINFNLDKLDKIRQALGTAMGAKIGILGSGKAADAHPGGLTNVELGMIHEYGSATNNIPPRSFLRLPIETKRAAIMKWLQSDTVKQLVEAGQIKRVYELLAALGEGIIQEGFETGGFGKWIPLKEATIKAKGSSKPLIDTGQLRRSITSEVVNL